MNHDQVLIFFKSFLIFNFSTWIIYFLKPFIIASKVWQVLKIYMLFL